MVAEPAKAGAEPPEGKRRAKKSAGGLLWLMVGVMAAASFALPTVLLFSAGMVPAFVAWIVDRNRDGYTPMAVGMLNLAGLLPSLLSLWMDGHSMGIAVRIMSDPLHLAVRVRCGCRRLGAGARPAKSHRDGHHVPQRIRDQATEAAPEGSCGGMGPGGDQEAELGVNAGRLCWRYYLRLTDDQPPSRSSIAALRIAFCSFSNARTSIWRTRSRLML